LPTKVGTALVAAEDKFREKAIKKRENRLLSCFFLKGGRGGEGDTKFITLEIWGSVREGNLKDDSQTAAAVSAKESLSSDVICLLRSHLLVSENRALSDKSEN
jgi:hypothetical protein